MYPEPFISAPYGHELLLYQLHVSAVNENLESIGDVYKRQLQKFEEVSGGELANDRMLLS